MLVQRGRSLLDPQTGSLTPTAQKRVCLEDLPGTLTVDQGQFAVLKHGAQAEQYLQTIGLGPCIALSLYDPSTQVAALSHNDGKDFRRMVTSMVETLERNGANPDLLQARIVGGMEGLGLGPQCARNLLEVREALLERKIPVVEQDVLGGAIQMRNIVLDTANGEMYSRYISCPASLEAKASQIPLPNVPSVIERGVPSLSSAPPWPGRFSIF